MKTNFLLITLTAIFASVCVVSKYAWATQIPVLTRSDSPPPAPAQSSPTGERPSPVLPVPLTMLRGFLRPPTPWAAGHRGVDLKALPGTTVSALLSGTVTFAGAVAGVGCITIESEGRRTTYQPVAPNVAEGEFVKAGQPIATLTDFGAHCHGCLHLGLEEAQPQGWEYADPTPLIRDWLQAALVRLYPD